MMACAASAALFFIGSRTRIPHSPVFAKALLVLALVVGAMIRWILAWQTPGNYDAASWEIAAEIFRGGGNVYAETARYNYSPVWFWVLGLIDRFREWLPALPLRPAVRLFLSNVDLATALVLWSWPRLSAWERARQSLLFYLNPVSFLLTGVHGHFDNLAVFFLVLGLWGWERFRYGSEALRARWLWTAATAALLVKHIVCYEVWIVCLHLFGRWRERLAWFAAASALFAVSFIPYWGGGREGILKNVLFYPSYPMPYGLSALPTGPLWTGVFALALFVYPLFIRRKELGVQMLLGFLFFLTFTTGLGVQYFVLPVALGALKPARAFFVYSIVATAYLLGSYFNMGIEEFSWVPLWTVWAAAAYWWASVHAQPAKTA